MWKNNKGAWIVSLILSPIIAVGIWALFNLPNPKEEVKNGVSSITGPFLPGQTSKQFLIRVDEQEVVAVITKEKNSNIISFDWGKLKKAPFDLMITHIKSDGARSLVIYLSNGADLPKDLNDDLYKLMEIKDLNLENSSPVIAIVN